MRGIGILGHSVRGIGSVGRASPRPPMGIAVPGAIAAKLVRPERTVVAFSGDGGSLMNVQELGPRYNSVVRGSGAAVAHVLAKDGVAGSNPVFRSGVIAKDS